MIDGRLHSTCAPAGTMWVGALIFLARFDLWSSVVYGATQAVRSAMSER